MEFESDSLSGYDYQSVHGGNDGGDQNLVHPMNWNSNAWLEPDVDSSYLLDSEPVEIFVLQDLEPDSVNFLQSPGAKSLALLPSAKRSDPGSKYSGGSQLDREFLRPEPPLFRPKTFWRKTRRSAVTGPAYSPASHLVRRAAFIAAGVSLDSPSPDLTALSVDSRASATAPILVPRSEFI